MHLKNIKLSGFKSFVDPTTIAFDQSLIAVVGPNGCGKSNIVDAIRWVMGESSAKTLRGESMADVIFNGSTARKPVGQASVQLTFDNGDGAIGGEYAGYAEIAIKRVASRDGTSNYFLNNTKCRRKDITDVFLGTGLGPRSYSVIEQGMISRFIEAKPEDLRIYLEEAAGISKYKERRRETENRIRHSRENLDRVEDLREEIGMQLEKLQRQAKAAERYKILKQEERLHKAQLLALHWQALNKRMESFEQIIKEAEVAIEARIAEQRRLSVEIEKCRESQTDASDALNEIQGRYYNLGAEIVKIEQNITHHKERYQQLQDDKIRLEQSTSELQQNIQDDRCRLMALQQELVSIEPQFNSAKEISESSSNTLHEAENNMQAWHQQWEIFNHDAAKSIQAVEIEQTRIEHAGQMVKEFSERIEKLSIEQKQFDFSELESSLEILETEQQQMNGQLTVAQQQLEILITKLNQQRENIDATIVNLDSAKEALQQAKGRQASLTALQGAALGHQDETIIKWLEKNNLHDRTRLAQQLTVASGWEKAVETVLGSHLEAICIDDFNVVEKLLKDIPSGSFEFFVNSDKNIASQNEERLLMNKVKGGEIDSLLTNIYCAESLSDAKKMLDQLDAKSSVITKEGIWLGHSWLRIAKDNHQQIGILQRENELQTLKVEIEKLEQQIDKLQQQIQLGKQNIASIEQEKESVQQQINEINHTIADVRSRYQVKQEQLQQKKLRAENIKIELAEQNNALIEQQQTLQQANDNWQQAINNSEHYSQKREQLKANGDTLRERLLTAKQTAQQDAERSHQLELRVGQLKPQIETLEESIQRADKQLNVLFERSQNLILSLETGDGPVAELQIELEKVLRQRVDVETELNAAKNRVDSITYQIREYEEQKETVAQDVEHMRRALEEQRLEGRTVDVRKKTYQEQLTELDYDLYQVLDQMPEEANLEQWQQQAEKFINRISRLGAINLAAIDEYKVQEERKQYLDSQYDDLIEALTTLENAIHKIDKETRMRFKETFDKVNDGFQLLFPKVFGGGSAHLELTGEDLLDTGINVIARPPGKRNTTIHLLSGGEKALTAVSLVFAIFHLNPAPFCLLDEVDAPLDDANIGRFCSLVKEMSEKTQFLFISHNKLAIEMANQLTGVTMQEPGVSRIVAVDVDEAVQLAAA